MMRDVNVERLHSIAQAVSADLQHVATVTTVQRLRDALRNQTNQPQDAAAQQQVSATLQELEGLSSSPSNAFPPTWRQTLEELQIDGLLGSELLDQIREIFARNQITPAVALQEIEEIATALTELDSGLSQLLAGLDHFKVGSEVLLPGQAELGILIPRRDVDQDLARLGREFVDLQQLFGPFVEIATGSRPPFVVQTIASSDFQVFLELAPKAGALIALGLERVVAMYKSVLEIRRLRQELEDQGVPTDDLASVGNFANNRMSAGIEEVVDELVTDTVVTDTGRLNELRVAVTLSLNGIANRIDKGYNIEVRASVEPLDDDSEAEVSPSDAQAVQRINLAGPSMRFINTSGKPILSLPEVPDEGVRQPETSSDG
jgi:hypothetical protein